MNYQEALSKLAHLCSQAEKSEYALRKKIQTWGFETVEEDALIQALFAGNFIDNKRFCLAYVRSKFKYNQWGKRKIAFELTRQGFSNDLIEESLESEISAADYHNCLFKLLQAKNRRIRDDSAWSRRGKLFRFAQSKGFEYESIDEVVNALVGEEAPDFE